MERIGRDMEPRLVSSNRVSVLHGTGLGSDIPCPQDRNCMSAKGGERHRSDQKQAQRATPRRAAAVERVGRDMEPRLVGRQFIEPRLGSTWNRVS